MATTSDRDERILLLLGELKAGLAGVREDMLEVKDAAADDRRDAKESRQRIYEKMEEGQQRLTKVESTVTVLGGVIAKSTERLDHLEPKVEHAASTIKVWSVRGGLIAAALAAFGGFAWWAVQSNWPFLWGAILKLLKGLG